MRSPHSRQKLAAGAPEGLADQLALAAFATHLERLARMQRSLGLVAVAAVMRERITENLRGDSFGNLYRSLDPLPKHLRRQALPPAERELAMPVAVMPDDLIEDIGGRDMLAALSGYTIRKQRAEREKGEGRENFRPVNPEDYVLVQRIMDGGAIYRNNYTMKSGGKAITRIGYARDDEGKLWQAVWKKAADGQVFLTSLHRVGEKDLAGTERRLGPPIKRERK